MDATVAVFAFPGTCGTALLFGLAPAASLGRADLTGWLGSRGTAERRGARRLRGALVVVQVALSLVLLVGAGLMVRSLVNRLDVGVGLDMERRLTTEIQVGGGGYDPASQARFFEELVERVTELPGADVRFVHRDYHRVMGIPVLAGRAFEAADRADALYWEHRHLNPVNLMSLVVRTEDVATTTVVSGIRDPVAELDPAIPPFQRASHGGALRGLHPTGPPRNPRARTLRPPWACWRPGCRRGGASGIDPAETIRRE